jgi:hypothetical protein
MLRKVMLNNFPSNWDSFLFEFSLLVIVLRFDVICRFFDLSVQPRWPKGLFNLSSLHVGIDHDEIIFNHFELFQLIQPLLSLFHVFVALQKIVLDPVLNRVECQRYYNHHK